jgi:hypothetical protein
MFETVSPHLPSSWCVELRGDGSLHLAPKAWLEPGFWESYFARPHDSPEAAVFEAEAERIIRES